MTTNFHFHSRENAFLVTNMPEIFYSFNISTNCPRVAIEGEKRTRKVKKKRIKNHIFKMELKNKAYI